MVNHTPFIPLSMPLFIPIDPWLHLLTFILIFSSTLLHTLYTSVLGDLSLNHSFLFIFYSIYMLLSFIIMEKKDSTSLHSTSHSVWARPALLPFPNTSLSQLMKSFSSQSVNTLVRCLQTAAECCSGLDASLISTSAAVFFTAVLNYSQACIMLR